MKPLPFFLASLLSVTPLLHAQTPPILSDEIVVTASALPETTRDTPIAATVITREAIEAREARDVADVLREVPGLAVARTGSPGKSTTLFIRGGSSKQALVLWNGIEVNDPYFSGYNIGQLSSAGVERVEVVRGPFSALYGSEAVSGVVNVLTVPSSTRGAVDLEAGERGLVNATASGALFRETWNAHAAGESRRDEGFAANDDYTLRSFLGGGTVHLTSRLTAGILGRSMRYDVGTPRTPDPTFTEFVASPSRREDGSEVQLALPVRYNDARTTVDFRASESRRHDLFADPDGPFGPERNDTESRIRSSRVAASRSTTVGTVTFGAEYEESLVDAESSFASVDSRRRRSRSAFVEDRLSLVRGVHSFEVTAGVRYDHFDSFGSETSPRVAAAWSRGVNKVRAAYGESFRAPSIGELYYPWGGNEELGPERSRNLEVGYERFTRAGTLSLSLFDAEYEGLIVFGEAFHFENLAAARARGLELGAGRRMGAVQLDLTYTFLDAEDRTTGGELLRRPRHSGSAAIGYDRGTWAAQVVVAHKGARADVTDLLPFGVVRAPGHTTADLSLHYRVGSLRPYVKLENLTDESYEEVFGYPSARRRISGGVRLQL